MMKVLVSQSGLTLCDPMDCSWPGSSVHGNSPGKNTRVGNYSRTIADIILSLLQIYLVNMESIFIFFLVSEECLLVNISKSLLKSSKIIGI